MTDTGMAAGSLDAVVTNETTMYIDLEEGFAEFVRLLRRRGRYVCVTWCANDVVSTRSKAVEFIDRRYVLPHPPPQHLLPGAGGRQPPALHRLGPHGQAIP